MNKPETFEYGSAHAYAEEVRNWMTRTHGWYAFHHMMAAQMTAAVTTVNNAVQQHNNRVVGAPPGATLIVTPDGERLLTATYSVPSFVRRVLAEAIDCIFAFAFKLILVYILIEGEIIDLDRYERLINDSPDLQTLIEITHELFPLELIGKVLCSIIEAYLISYGFGSLPPGMTPGKNIMGLRVISCRLAQPVIGDPRSVIATGYERVPFKKSLTRALFKNVLVNSLIPLSSIVYVFNYNRALYDVMSHTLVVRRM